MTLSDRAIKAMTLVADGLGDARTSDGQRLIRSQSKDGAYYLTTEDDCSCKDRAYRGGVCKHMLAARLARVIDEAQPAERRLEVVS